MKTLFSLLTILFLSFSNYVYSDDEERHTNELEIANWSSSIIRVDVYPVGTVFNGDKLYKLRCKNPYSENYDYIIGGSNLNVPPEAKASLNHDASQGGTDINTGAIGYGKYRIDIYEKDGNNWNYVNYCFADFSHSNYPWQSHPYLQNDMAFEYNGEGEITCWGFHDLPSDRTVKIWDQRDLSGNPNAYENQVKSGFKTSNSENGIWLNFPLVATDYGGVNHITPGVDNLFIEVLNGHTANLNCSKSFSLASQTMLKIVGNSTNQGTKFYLGSTENNPNCGALFTASSGSLIWVGQNTEFIARTGTILTLNNQSSVRIDLNSRLWMKSGTKLCLNGSPRFYGQGYTNGGLFIQGIVSRLCGDPGINTPLFDDSIKVRLDTNSILELPDSTILTFSGNETALFCDSSSTIKFGKGSKLIFKDGARISADNTKFVSYDSTESWDGIYITGDSYDTLKNCTFENAENGVNIGSSGLRPGILTTTLITNCTFNNRTNTKFSNQVYVYGNNPTLISGCNTVSDLSEGFSNAILLEYCGAGYVVICDNNFDNISCGIAAIQSSPYIARNIIACPSGSGTGISLDNSNGTIEYNKIYNFEQSVYCLYSSPYMLKNTLSDASEMNLSLNSYSAPVLKPVTAGSITRWLGGNNLFTGAPNGSAFNFSEDCAPLMDSGYNVISVSEAYYISAELSGDFYATLNNWYDDPPDPDLFETSGGRIIYEPYFDGTSLPSTDYFELNSLGFDLYDSVYVKDLTETSTVDSYFMQAYLKEMEADYADAIVKYKYVVSDFKTTSYAPVSIARIFACLEKANSSNSAFQQIQSYYAGINSDTGNTTTVRELAEDFMIKSKVKQGMIEEAISDYNAIYQANTGNSTGVHALLNKACLEHILSFGDNMSSSTSGYAEHKGKLLSILLGKEIRNNHISINNTIPGNFKLYQNYPNPFNPVTSIKYDIPKDNFVNIRIYDLLGREVFSSGEFKKAGSYEVKFDGTNFASGMYFYSIETGSFRETKKMVLIK